MKKNILIVDATYPKAYDSLSIDRHALGGTEASVIRTAKILSQNNCVYVVQKSRHDTTIESPTLSFLPFAKIDNIKADVIIVLRKYPIAKVFCGLFPKALVFLWIHTYKNYEYALRRPGFARLKIAIICNSQTHKNHTSRILNNSFLGRLMSFFWPKIAVNYCYNPIVKPQVVSRRKDVNKLVFFSSPNKGLKQVLKCFQDINKKIPNLRLYIANPGYKTDENNKVDNTVILGSLPHQEMMQHVQQSLCVFYPQDSFAETFGLIYAEANAYGVPVLAHDIGSAREILDDNNPLIDINDKKQVLNTVQEWQKKYPEISYNQKFSDPYISAQWHKLWLD